ncbi:S41 family peptidase [Chloroflexota bacterium]
MLRRFLYRIGLVASLICLLSFALGAGCGESLFTNSKSRSAPEEMELIEEAWQLILDDFVDRESLDVQELRRGAIEGMIRVLDDPYTSYISADLYELGMVDFKGSFEGIGAEITMRDGQLTVVSPINGSPAERAGIKPGDSILQIDGQSTAGMSLMEAVLMIRGDRGTSVRLNVLHTGSETPEEITITRDEITMESVNWEMLAEDIAYISISHFSEGTGSEMVSALRSSIDEGARGVVLDLRYNPGGILEEAIGVASQFLEEGIVVYAVDGKGREHTWDARPGGLAIDMPMAVIVNGSSASASEVVAAAIQDYERAPIIGSKTFGKGSINQFSMLSDGSALYITIGRWFSPNGRRIDGQGLSPTPGFEVQDDGDGGEDPQLDRALEYLGSRL